MVFDQNLQRFTDFSVSTSDPIIATSAIIEFEETGLNKGNISIQCEANSSDESTLLYVLFCVDGEIVDSDSQEPFITNWQPDRPGFFSIWSIAVDDRGNKVSSDPLTIMATPFGSPESKIITPLGTTGDPVEVSLGSRIPLVVDARAKVGDIENSSEVLFRISNGEGLMLHSRVQHLDLRAWYQQTGNLQNIRRCF